MQTCNKLSNGAETCLQSLHVNNVPFVKSDHMYIHALN